jgi:hypothetical protein
MASPLHQSARKKFIKWGNEWRYISISEMKVFLKDFRYTTVKTTGFMSAFGRNEFLRSLFFYCDKAIFNHIIPDKWRYIVYGIATK